MTRKIASLTYYLEVDEFDEIEEDLTAFEKLQICAEKILDGSLGILLGGMYLFGICRDLEISYAPHFNYLWALADDAGDCGLTEGDRYGRSEHRMQQMDKLAAELEQAYRNELLETCRFISTLDHIQLQDIANLSRAINNCPDEPRFSGLKESLSTMPETCSDRQRLPAIFRWWNRAFTWIEEFDSVLSQDLSDAVSGLSAWCSDWQIELYRERGKEKEEELMLVFRQHAANYLKVRQSLLDKFQNLERSERI